MAARFHARRHSDPQRLNEPSPDSGLGEWWAAIAVLALAAAALGALSGGTDSPTPRVEIDPLSPQEILESLTEAEESLAAVERAFEGLCQDPVLLALELAPDCETGVMTLTDGHFAGFGSAELGREAREDVRAAFRIYLRRLRRAPEIWQSLEAIEIRGHSDPRATRSPYTTNLVGSQQRPLGVLFFLTSPEGLADRDRADLERLAVVSGASFSRPPASCPEATRECYPAWRRVEIRPVLSERQRRSDWARTVDGVRLATQRVEPEREAQ
jgi:outer membrane protein OmpA-like peptidoglycan-associated protein